MGRRVGEGHRRRPEPRSLGPGPGRSVSALGCSTPAPGDRVPVREVQPLNPGLVLNTVKYEFTSIFEVSK